VHVCGSPPMVQALRARLLARGVPAASIHFESFDFR
jgi:ferredoxin-NADP reductase